MAYSRDDIDDGSKIGPGGGSASSASQVNDATSEQVTEIINGGAITTGVPTGDPFLDPETVYRKRIVKIVDGKIVATSHVYIQRYMIAKSGGYGDGYQFLVPVRSGDTITGFTPATITLP